MAGWKWKRVGSDNRSGRGVIQATSINGSSLNQQTGLGLEFRGGHLGNQAHEDNVNCSIGSEFSILSTPPYLFSI